jgi:hypothetical protein
MLNTKKCQKLMVLCLVVLVCSCLFISISKADVGGVDSYSPDIAPQESANTSRFEGVQNINPAGSPLIFPAYNTTTVTLVYAESTNYTIQVSAMDMHHYETSSPSGIIFVAEGLDSYSLHYCILYDKVVNQSLSLTVVSGDGQATMLPLACCNKGFSLDVVVVTSIQPHYPNPEDIWAYGTAEQQEMMLNITRRYEEQQQTDRIALYVLVGAVAIIAVTLVLTFRHFWKKDQGNINFRRRHGE